MRQAARDAASPSAASLPRPLAARLQACAATVPKKAAVAWAQFVATIAQLEGEDVRGQCFEDDAAGDRGRL